MKSKLLKSLVLVVFASQVNAQQGIGVIDGTAGFLQSFDFNKFRTADRGKGLLYADVQGTPYFNKQYENVKVEGFKEVVMARYNMYSDEVEFMRGDDVLSFPQTKEYSNIQFVNSKQALLWRDGGVDQSGYFFILSNGKNKLLRKNKTKFTDAKAAATSYSEASPAKFTSLPASYFILTEANELVPLKNSKEIANYFPAQKDKINSFIKSNKIKTDKEPDLIKLQTFINEN